MARIRYFVSAFIRIMIFAGRIELVSPEHLPDVLDTEKIRFSLSNRRNLTLTAYAVHDLPYLGLGTGIPRAINAWPMITLDNDRQGSPFRGIIRRAVDSGTLSVLSRDQVGAKSGPSGTESAVEEKTYRNSPNGMNADCSAVFFALAAEFICGRVWLCFRATLAIETFGWAHS
ncbi:hypothetical protein ALP64_203776 [Pseudomonas syringae pv. actinidiae]|nr:ATP-dependent DNA helicase [Pseudomonas syringae]RMS57184.1 hypothetical protein ALP64_203776 [Pseudomonas syringae pv. actinidiae]EPM82970.1 ATP-dependent DNA helicase [Pseudomonas syringae pv. actinidiae ICMP 19068]EPM93192.1 ATP-dependent DNA helicase [Pseudomonas syringae pv. actinidiae ICMP 19104]EPN07783.1 ATP-dependent DNA helicase [Pseudomonas syringae pv. actinidiae ICMP 9855]MDG6382621.1 ATP-dependent DNA helicase [Pseudomonas syringae]